VAEQRTILTRSQAKRAETLAGCTSVRISARFDESFNLVVRGGIEPPTPGFSDRSDGSGIRGRSVDSPYTPTVSTSHCLALNRPVSCCLADQMQTKLRRQRPNILNLLWVSNCQGACGLGGRDWVGPHRLVGRLVLGHTARRKVWVGADRSL
jgi:hypothetical protein